MPNTATTTRVGERVPERWARGADRERADQRARICAPPPRSPPPADASSAAQVGREPVVRVPEVRDRSRPTSSCRASRRTPRTARARPSRRGVISPAIGRPERRRKASGASRPIMMNTTSLASVSRAAGALDHHFALADLDAARSARTRRVDARRRAPARSSRSRFSRLGRVSSAPRCASVTRAPASASAIARSRPRRRRRPRPARRRPAKSCGSCSRL